MGKVRGSRRDSAYSSETGLGEDETGLGDDEAGVGLRGDGFTLLKSSSLSYSFPTDDCDNLCARCKD